MKCRVFLPLLLASVIANPCGSSATQTCRTADLPATTPSSRFAIHGDGTVTDSVTGLTWKQCSEGLSGDKCEIGTAGTYFLQDAHRVADKSDFAGKGDWRLPTIAELDSIIEYQCTMPAVNATVFPRTPASNFWSASPYAGYANGMWNVNFNDGVRDNCSRNYRLYLRLVRGGNIKENQR